MFSVTLVQSVSQQQHTELIRGRSVVLNQDRRRSLNRLLAILRRRPFRPAHACYRGPVLDGRLPPGGLRRARLFRPLTERSLRLARGGRLRFQALLRRTVEASDNPTLIRIRRRQSGAATTAHHHGLTARPVTALMWSGWRRHRPAAVLVSVRPQVRRAHERTLLGGPLRLPLDVPLTREFRRLWSAQALEPPVSEGYSAFSVHPRS